MSLSNLNPCTATSLGRDTWGPQAGQQREEEFFQNRGQVDAVIAGFPYNSIGHTRHIGYRGKPRKLDPGDDGLHHAAVASIRGMMYG